MAMSQWTAPTKLCPQAYQHNAETTTLEVMIDPHLRVTIAKGITSMTIEIGTGSADLNLTPIILDIGVTVAVTLPEVTLDLFTDPHVTAHHATELGHILSLTRHATLLILIMQQFLQR